MFFLDIIDLYFRGSTAFGVISRKSACNLEDMVRELPVFGFHNYMGTCHFFCVEPPVIASGEFEGQLIILEVIFAHIDVVTVISDVRKCLDFACIFWPFCGRNVS